MSVTLTPRNAKGLRFMLISSALSIFGNFLLWMAYDKGFIRPDNIVDLLGLFAWMNLFMIMVLILYISPTIVKAINQ